LVLDGIVEGESSLLEIKCCSKANGTPSINEALEKKKVGFWKIVWPREKHDDYSYRLAYYSGERTRRISGVPRKPASSELR